ncbi:hypothetical protein [Streptomyces resistomycificus]|uniref:hypothetical protein n=1 Tax=Streptomyces resistomycificus TaxID=67356 RepID=UPI000A81FA1B|nr:hypothetical protein [Streptomyces resistomycificus]
MSSHPSADDMRHYISETARLAADTPADDPRHQHYHEQINKVMDQMDREGGVSYGLK